jgi:hypothetical protein
MFFSIGSYSESVKFPGLLGSVNHAITVIDACAACVSRHLDTNTIEEEQAMQVHVWMVIWWLIGQGSGVERGDDDPGWCRVPTLLLNHSYSRWN